ncbi:MAG TPA: LTA synthase family protein [Chitinophagaceae bacterium]|nr:LTA synthase family protein [Chitinophagaceae bacterium]
MLIRLKIPKTLLWVVNLLVIFLLIFTLFRLATYFAFVPPNLSFTDLIPSFWLGLRYDLRWIALALLPIVLVSLVPELSPFYSARNKKWWTWYLAGITFIIFFFFAADFGCFSYNKTRLGASALNFVEDAHTSLAMLWQTYPLFWMLLGLVVAVLFFRSMYRRSHWSVIARTDGLGIPYRRKWFIIAALILGVLIYGNLGWPPLKRNNAFVFRDSFKSYLALNPLQNFFTTLRFRSPEFNERKARESFPVMAEWMGLEGGRDFSYRREYFPGGNAIESRPNIVLVLCESFSMYKSSMSGNPLNTTPFFDSLSREGIFFTRCFAPHFSTARGLFATLTGIPDVQLSKFSTRNPLALEQHMIINHFEGYSKMYFLGGDPDFNNFSGLLRNIDGLQMFTENSFRAPEVNVWGISDKNLFLEANQVFSRQKKPFFAIIQTADNHRPFMIPSQDSDFVRREVPGDTLRRYGFESLNEFNSFRYSDYCFARFIEAARQQPYFHNTLFVFVGDHGVSGNAEAVYPPVWTDQRLTDEHVPLLFYAPYLLNPSRHGEVVSQIDVLPTLAGMLHQPYVNTTLGRDLLSPAKKNDYAFTIHHDEGRIGMVTDSFYFERNINFPDERLYALDGHPLNLDRNREDSIKHRLSIFTTAFYETARWMLMNNKKD